MPFPDRAAAGRLLAEKLTHYANRKDVAVVALPPGGVPVAYEIAQALSAPLDLLVIRYLGVPENPALVMGAVAADGTHFLNYEVIRWLKIPDSTIGALVAIESAESRRLDKLYRGETSHLEVVQKAVILVDDGISTFSAIRVAVTVLRLRRAAEIAVAVPIAPSSSALRFRAMVNEFVTCAMPGESVVASQWYEDFRRVSQESVCALYERANRSLGKIGTPKANRRVVGNSR